MSDTPLKLTVIGPKCVGKTCLCVVYDQGGWYPRGWVIGNRVDVKPFYTKPIPVDGIPFKVEVWDFFEEDIFPRRLDWHLPGTDGVLLCFDVTQATTLEILAEWLPAIREYLAPGVPIYLVGLKTDRPDHEVSEEVAQQWNHDHGLQGAWMVSAIDGTHRQEVFESITRSMLAYRKKT